MDQLKKSILPFLAIMAAAIMMMDFGSGEIGYELASYDSMPESHRQFLSDLGPGGTGMFEYDGSSYAFIGTNPDEKIEILFVGKAEDGIGNEVKYKVVKKGETDPVELVKGRFGDYALHLIRLEKVVSPPFGFHNIDL